MTTSKRKPEDDSNMRVLRTGSCKSTSGKSTLSYQIGCTPDSSIHIRITKNSGAGFFNNEWVAIEGIEKALAGGPKKQPLTSFLLHNLLSGRSTNSPAFLMAALSKERLLRVLKGKKRGHEFLDPEGFTDRMDKLVSAKANAGVKTKATVKKTTKVSTKKAAVKKKASTRRKTTQTH